MHSEVLGHSSRYVTNFLLNKNYVRGSIMINDNCVTTVGENCQYVCIMHTLVFWMAGNTDEKQTHIVLALIII